MNGDTFSIKAPKACSKKLAATFKGQFLTRGNVLRIFFLFLEDFGAPLLSYSDITETKIFHANFVLLKFGIQIPRGITFCISHVRGLLSRKR